MKAVETYCAFVFFIVLYMVALTYAFVTFQVNATIARALQPSLVTSLGVTI